MGEEIPGPIGGEYKRMGDALRLGVDQSEVFASASKRIGVPEFKFFAVCLELQRETGGPLSDTLENLAAIIRARMDVRLKTRALTAEGRMASKVIATIPLAITGGLYVVGGDYIDVLIHTETGHHLVALAVGMIVLGQAIIFRMTKLEA
ncbi:type II secretion system F family protein [Magnetospirillum fulvum]|uniref:Pilus assembly protein n=1 Tax=Magnetospirillum fulvum MGU-K5 TaxID=1316936 RepID=S9TFV5_MAGFU|nr:type II secretion system F family protein [Magnetospirillum fulvum]EPY01126.1 pilus assembly protein [Magnetospirillum fulvum MGU-K5]